MTKSTLESGGAMHSIPKTGSKVTWKTLLTNPFIFGIMAIPMESDNTLMLISTSLLLVISSLLPLGIPRVPFPVSIACIIIFISGCGIGGLALVNVLEQLFPNFPTVKQWPWVQHLPSVLGNLSILAWVFVVLNVSPVNGSLVMGTSLVAAAAGYGLTLDAVAIREALVFGVTHEIADWERGVAMLLNGCALIFWAHFVARKLANSQYERVLARCTLFVGVISILGGIFGILWDIFS